MRREMVGAAALAVGLGALTAATPAGESARDAAPYAVSPGPQELPGRALFRGKGTCFACHGQDAEGTAVGPDLTDAEWLNFEARPDLEAVETLIREGVASPEEHPAPMPPMGGARLSDEEITQLAEYVLSLSQE